MLCGGTSAAKTADAEVQKICDEVKPQVESQTNRTFHIFKAVQYKSQVVAGTNYFIKVHVGGVEYIHLRIFRSLPVHGNELKVHGVQSPKGEQDEIDYF
ncbi:cystatin-B-like [Erpetoichthys calabaricus]|uniref:Cystatin-B n=1 Tax=Erpetoichthys calabaricus TaxID=27687 RepID=A0A8C4RSS0_ERPCA|nr:cystatin-B-like [Erpetoichthys calabaricus]